MNLTEMLLDKLMEECAEVIQRAAKANRFGLDEVQSGQDKTNRTRLVEEVLDVAAVLKYLQELQVIPYTWEVNTPAEVAKRRDRIEWYLQHSRAQGTLQDGD